MRVSLRFMNSVRGDRRGASYFIVVDQPDPGFDTFVNGKAIAREAERLSSLASSLGLKAPEEYFSMGGDDASSLAGEFGVDEDIQLPPEQWFSADEGLEWVARLSAHLQSHSDAVEDAEAVLADLAEYGSVLSQARAVGARWHLSVDI